MTPNEEQVAVEILQDYFRYDPASGHLYWKIFGRNRLPNKPVGSINSTGYRVAKFLNLDFMVHRIIWALHTGAWPKEFIDHIDGSKQHNRFENLREASRIEQSQNRAVRKTQKYPKGVHKHPCGKYRAAITRGGKRQDLGLHATPEDAANAYNSAAEKLFGVFASALARNTNIV